MQAIKDEVLMEFFWVADSVRPFYQWHPERYVTHVIGHEGKNSLLSLLKAKDWASKIVSYSHDLPKQTIFGLEVHLTENGEESYESVYHLVTEYVASLKAEKHIFDEIKEAAAVEFQFK
jgi:secreted Zn-dependent insulinase-like peptidase